MGSKSLMLSSCLEELERLRTKMMEAAKELGIKDPSVLKYSEQIDETHNKILRLEYAALYTK
ncbi:Spo0E family sporulation regulatory protein-aspartic acid phosphatase [Fictibacillus iocasae]|uniref:Spo0E family sporulation regulatory protein-aspartic acid phosphatase n=1 Tax=Fictibacillus iocasae TaxID=2715437 RepID=A0ABW2NT19_9BACL